MGFAQNAKRTCLVLSVASMVSVGAGNYFFRQQKSRIEWEQDSQSKYGVPPIVLFADEKSFDRSDAVRRLPTREKNSVLLREEGRVESFGRDEKVDSALARVDAQDCSGSTIPVSFRGSDVGTDEERTRIKAKMERVFALLDSVPCSIKPGNSWFDVVSSSVGWITIDYGLEGYLGLQDGAEVCLGHTHASSDSVQGIAGTLVHESAHVFTESQGMREKTSFWNRVYNGLALFCTSSVRLAKPIAGEEADSVASSLGNALALSEYVTSGATSDCTEKQAIFVQLQFLKDASAKLGSSALLEHGREESLLYSMRREEFSSIINDNLRNISMQIAGTIGFVLFGLSAGFFFLVDETAKIFRLPKKKEQS